MHPPQRTLLRSPGFTLIELLVVIAIIGLLAAILFPVFARARENARRSSCQSNLKQLTLGFSQYLGDYDERYPQAWDTDLSLAATASWSSGLATGPVDAPLLWPSKIFPYVKNRQIFNCPSKRLGTYTDKAGCTGTPQQVKVGWMASDDDGTDAKKVTYGYNAFFLGGGQLEGYGSGCRNTNVTLGGVSYSNGIGALESTVLAPSSTLLLVDNHFQNRNQTYPAFAVGAPTLPDADDDARLGCTSTGASDPADSFPRIHFNGMNVAFCDGHVKWMTKEAVLYRPASYSGSCTASLADTDPAYIWNRF